MYWNTMIVRPCILIFFLTSVAARGADREWSVYQPADSACLIKLPTNPEYQTQMADAMATHIYISKDMSRTPPFIYTVAIGDYPKEKLADKDSAKKILDSDRDSFVKAVNGKLVSETSTAVRKFPGRCVVVSAEDGQARHLFCEYLVENRVIQLAVCVPSTKTDDPDVIKFFDSFQVLKK